MHFEMFFLNIFFKNIFLNLKMYNRIQIGCMTQAWATLTIPPPLVYDHKNFGVFFSLCEEICAHC